MPNDDRHTYPGSFPPVTFIQAADERARAQLARERRAKLVAALQEFVRIYNSVSNDAVAVIDLTIRPQTRSEEKLRYVADVLNVYGEC